MYSINIHIAMLMLLYDRFLNYYFLKYVTVPFLTILFAMILTCFFAQNLIYNIGYYCMVSCVYIDHACTITRY
jgi:hypothetical protein